MKGFDWRISIYIWYQQLWGRTWGQETFEMKEPNMSHKKLFESQIIIFLCVILK